jgi:O-antigen ligase
MWMLFCASLVAAIGLLQAAQFGPINAWLNRLYPSSHAVQLAEAGRVTSVMGGWNLLGTFLMVNLLLAWSLMTSGHGGPGVAAAMAVCALGLIASGSFAGMAGVGMGGLLILILNRRQGRGFSSTVVALLAAGLIALFVFPLVQPLLQQRLTYQFARGVVPQTLQFRFKVWAEVFWPVIRQNLLWGVNLTIPTTYTWRWAESEYLLTLFRFGIWGLAAEVAWLGVTLGWLHARTRRVAGFGRALAVATLGILAVLAVAGLTNSVLSFFGTAEYLWILLALALAGNGELRPAQPPEVRTS